MNGKNEMNEVAVWLLRWMKITTFVDFLGKKMIKRSGHRDQKYILCKFPNAPQKQFEVPSNG